MSDVGIVGIANVLISLSGIFVIPLITKALGAHDYGIYVQFTVTISLVLSFATLGLPYSMVRFLAGSKDRRQIQDDLYSSIALILVFSLLISLILIIFSQTLAGALFENATILIKILAIIIPVDCIGTTLLNTFRVFHEIKKYTLYSTLKTYVEIGAIALVILMGYGITEMAVAILVVRFIFLLIMSSIIVFTIGLGLPSFKRSQEYVKFGLPTVPSNVASWVTNSSSRYVIGMLIGLTYVGYYNPGYNLGAMIAMFTTPINFVLVSLAPSCYEEDKIDLLRQIFKFSIKYYLMLAVPGFFGLSILSKPILAIISTPAIAENGYLVTPLSAFSFLILGLGGVSLGFACYLCKKTYIDMINWILVALINLGASIILVPRMGIIGAALATLMAVLFGFVFGCYFAFKYFDFDIDIKSIIKIVIASLIMSAVLVNIHPSTLKEILLTVALGVAVYGVSIVPLRLIGEGEINLIKSYIKMGR